MKLRARSLDQTLDHQNIWLWIQACNVRHAERCIATPVASRQSSQVPDWVIDTTAACLVPGSSVDKYVALSYVWPSPAASPADTLLLERATLPDFQTPGFFFDDCVIARIPQIIQDAVRLTQGFGERFIWVDRLCLIQNDNETYIQVQRMHEIYWGAYVTIVAAASGSLYGRLDCLKPATRDWQRNDFPLHANDDSSWSDYHRALMHEHYARLSRSKWGTRGWTYQEKILSRRTVILLDDDLFWDCQCALWDCNGLDPFTDTMNGGGEDGHRHLKMRLTPYTSVDFSLYVELVCPYNARDLSYAQDVVPAFTGVLNTLAPAFPGGFAAGIPLAYMDHMLLWQPRGSVVRREGTTNPSWSWTGWQCEIDPWSLRSGLATVTGQPSALERAGSWSIREAEDRMIIVASPEASWHVAAGQVRAGQIEVQQDGQIWFNFTNIDDSTSLSDPVHFGSVPREISPADTLLLVLTSSAFLWVRAMATAFQEPPEADVRFRRLFSKPPRRARKSPVGGGGLFGQNTVTSPSGVGFGSLSKVSVYEPPFSSSLDSLREGTSLILSDFRGRFAGVVRVLDGQPQGTTVELIALSQGSVQYRDLDAEYEERWRQEGSQGPPLILEAAGPPYPRLCDLLSSAVVPSIMGAGGDPPAPPLPGPLRTDAWTGRTPRVMYPEDDGIFEFYNVLLIQRVGEIAYRRGCGRVPKRMWEENASPSKRLILG